MSFPILDPHIRLNTPAMALSMQSIMLKEPFYRTLQPSLG